MAAATIPLDELAYDFPAATGPTARRKQCVLSIEDSKDAMWLVLVALEKYGYGKYRLEWANCLSDGLSRILKGGIDVVLLDLGLPDCSSHLSYAWVREAAPDVPVVILTGDASEETEFSVFASGAEHYLVKGQASGAVLVNAIEEALDPDLRRS
jgi:DNA-binding response OmpR family regulator